MKILLLLLLPFTFLAQHQEGYVPCSIQRDSMLTRLNDQMQQLKKAVSYQYKKDAHFLSLYLKYKQSLIESGNCVFYEERKRSVEWEVEEATLDGFMAYRLGLLMSGRKKQRFGKS
ncbi:MAG: hypothetical protein AAF599_11570 [Bacteroidota bacterium]